MDRKDERDARALVAALAQDEANRRSAFEWADRSWCANALPRGGAPAAPALAACAPRWLARIGMAPQPLRALRGPAGSLAALPMADLLRLLRLRALWPRRAELRNWIDRPRRARLAANVGQAAAEALRRDSVSALRVPAWLEASPELEAMSDEALAWDGYCLFACDDIWPEDGPPPLVRVALPRDAAVPPWIMRYRSAVDAGDRAAVLGYLPLIAPENE